MKPLARMEYVGLFGRWMILSDGETRFGDFSEESEARLVCENINAAHRAAVKKELEALKKLFIAEAIKHVCADITCPCGCSVAAKQKAINIDVFLDREEKKCYT